MTLRPNAGYRVATFMVNSEVIDVSTLTKVEHSNVRTYELTVDQDNTIVWAGFEKVPTRVLRLSTSDCGSVTIFDSEENVLNSGDGEYRVPEEEEIYIQMDSDDVQNLCSSMALSLMASFRARLFTSTMCRPTQARAKIPVSM